MSRVHRGKVRLWFNGIELHPAPAEFTDFYIGRDRTAHDPGDEDPSESDFLDDLVTERTARNPDFPRLVAEAIARRAK